MNFFIGALCTFILAAAGGATVYDEIYVKDLRPETDAVFVLED